ncbi:MAG: PEP-CTERM sorting domain-containing protein [Desulfobacter postgatei]|uniref:PEP-CTERM sorting domain-containing protein n=1 Tax=Desulfobacter postgatei TaxID=2293 RepID=UPI0023EFA135|nr:PEP-CTERM sorting domain-containing protein [Desulfobacter postgatei]MDD4273675.1 PEP-CTERM sorting domain-containing protein [Desulfobacter postgatei]
MKKVIFLGILVFCSLFIASILYATPIISFEYSPDISVGDTLEISVTVDGVLDDPVFGGDLMAFGFDLDFDSLEFDYLGTVVESPFYDDSTLFLDTDVAGSAMPAVGGDGILLATMSFTALTDGDLTISIISDLLDLNEGLITFVDGVIDMTTDLEIHVSKNLNSVPEPSTFILLSFGLLGFSRLRRISKK